MMHRRSVFLVLLGVLSVLSPAFAETYVEFSDGRYLAIRDHEIGDGWVRLELARNSWMVIPTESVTRIDGERGALWVRNEPDDRFLRRIRTTGQTDRAVARMATQPEPAAPSRGLGDPTTSRTPPIR